MFDRIDAQAVDAQFIDVEMVDVDKLIERVYRSAVRPVMC
jgi:shikimate kinase